MSKKKNWASMTSAGLVFAMLLSQSAVADFGTERVKAAENTEKWVDTEYVVNGDFESSINEDGSITGWTKSTGSGLFVTKDEWAVNNTTQFTKIKDITGDNSLYQTIKNVEPGTYRISIDQDGQKDVKSGLYVKYLEQAKELPATTDWDNWETVTTDEFTIEAVQDVDICIGGDVTNGYWGDIDNIKLQKLYEKESDDTDSSEENQKGYKISVNQTEVAVENGDTVNLEAKVTYDGEEISELPEGINLWWWVDTWNDHTDGLNDGTLENDNGSGKTLKAVYTTKSAGKYYVVAQLKDADGNELGSVYTTITSKAPEIDTSVDNDDIVVAKVKNLSSDFIMGMDISSVITEFNSGVVYKDYNGKEIDNVTDFCKFLAENGINHIRVRVWNDPYDSNRNGYGGGNNDVATAKKIADACRSAGIKMLVDFHCSDFWADPSKQMVPKAWKGYTVDEKVEAVEKFIKESLNTIDASKDVVDMVQVGNETTGGFVGETKTDVMCRLFSAGSKGVKEYNSDAKVVIHVESPQKNTLTTWSDNLEKYNVDYDILGTSYYPYWHGTLSNLKDEISYVQTKHNKDAMVVETSYAYTLDDSDGCANTVREGNNDDSADATEPFTVQGQATYIRNLINAVNEAGGLGVYYWEPAWITVGDTTGLSEEAAAARYEANKKIWEEKGSGWAASYGGEYDPNDAGKWYGGSAVDNQAMFYPDGTATAGLKVWNYVKTGAKVTKIGVEDIETANVTAEAGKEIELPKTVNVTYNTEKVEENVVWNTEGIDFSKAGTYTVEGTVKFSRKIERGAYKDKTSGTTKCTVVIKQKNLITDADDAGFEKADNFTTDNSIVDSVSSTKDDKKSGEACAHWYNGGEDKTEAAITYNKAITLASGEYIFEYVGQGADGDELYAEVMDSEGNIIAKGDNVTLEGWKNWKTPSVSFKLEKETKVTLVVRIVSAKGGWGTADDLYLYQTKSDDKPDEGNNKPDDSNQMPDEGNNKPDNSNQTPDGGNNKPDNSNQTPDGGNNKPDDSNQTPDEGNNKPDDSNQTPDGGNNKPDDSNQTPDGGNNKPDDSNQTPDGGNNKPDDSNQTPDEGNNKPDDSNQTPDGGNNKPDDSNQTPDGGNNKPDDSNQTPDGGNNKPDDSNQTPDGGNNKPDDSNQTPDGGNNKPDDSNQTPDGGNNKPDDSNQTPDGGNNKPDDSNQTPDGGNNKPDNSNQTPDGGNNKPDDSNQTPDGGNNKPDDSNQTPDEENNKPAETLTPGAVVASKADSTTTIKDTKGILPATVKFESNKVTDEKEVSKVTDIVNKKIVGVKALALYELNLTDGTTQIHQLEDKVQVTMDMPFTLASDEAIKVFRVDGEKLFACKASIIDGRLVFETDHFSTFAFVKVKTSSYAASATDAKAAKTSDDNNMYMWLIIAMSGLGVTIAAIMAKKKNVGE